MITYHEGNLLEAPVEAVVNTVNTVGVMGKGIALMFKERFPANFRAYAEACRRGEVRTGAMFVTRSGEEHGPRWIVNFPSKRHWRNPSKMEWVVEGLADLRRVIVEEGIRSIALPPVGCGNGGLDWGEVREEVERALEGLRGVDVRIYGPTGRYQNVAKAKGVERLTPARALVAEMVRRYGVVGNGCTYVEVQKLGWFLERAVQASGLENPLRLEFVADRYGSYSDRLRHLLNGLDGSYLHCKRRLSDAGPGDAIWFDRGRRPALEAYLGEGEMRVFAPVLELATKWIGGFESPLGMELLATVDWLVEREGASRSVEGIRAGLARWPGGAEAGERKLRQFDERLIGLALGRLGEMEGAARAVAVG